MSECPRQSSETPSSFRSDCGLLPLLDCGRGEVMIGVRAELMSEKKQRGAWSCISIGTQMVAATFVGAAIGWWLDMKTGWSPIFLISFFLLGSIAGFISVYRAFRIDGEKRP